MPHRMLCGAPLNQPLAEKTPGVGGEAMPNSSEPASAPPPASGASSSSHSSSRLWRQAVAGLRQQNEAEEEEAVAGGKRRRTVAEWEATHRIDPTDAQPLAGVARQPQFSIFAPPYSPGYPPQYRGYWVRLPVSGRAVWVSLRNNNRSQLLATEQDEGPPDSLGHPPQGQGYWIRLPVSGRSVWVPRSS